MISVWSLLVSDCCLTWWSPDVIYGQKRKRCVFVPINRINTTGNVWREAAPTQYDHGWPSEAFASQFEPEKPQCLRNTGDPAAIQLKRGCGEVRRGWARQAICRVAGSVGNVWGDSATARSPHVTSFVAIGKQKLLDSSSPSSRSLSWGLASSCTNRWKRNNVFHVQF